MKLHDQFEKLAEKLQFIKQEMIVEDLEKGKFIARGIVGGSAVLLKAISLDNVEKVETFEREVAVDSVIDRFNSRQLAKISTIRVLKNGKDFSLFWVLREFLPGKSLGKAVKNDSLEIDRLSYLDETLVMNSSEIIPQITNNVNCFQEIQEDKVELSVRSFPNRFEKDIDRYNLSEIEDNLGRDLGPTSDFYRHNLSFYLSPQNRVACTGDLTPLNLIVKNDGALILSDFEWFCFDNKFIDYAFLWLFLWRYPSWQKELVQRVIKSTQDEDSFRSSVIREILHWYNNSFDPTAPNSEKIRKKRELYSAHIWSQYLESAGNSFDRLVS